MSNIPSLNIVIVNWNSGTQLLDCLDSFSESSMDGFHLNRIIVVDNASTDRSISVLQDEGLNLPIHYIMNENNLGFASACNQGARECSGDYILFLNPDTKLHPKSLLSSVQFMQLQENNSIGVLGIQLVDENGHISKTCARFPSVSNLLSRIFGLNKISFLKGSSYLMEHWDHKESSKVDQVMGSYFFVRKLVFDKLNGFDSRFFVYFEEVDFSLRAMKLGFSSYYLAEVQAFHKGGGTSDQVKARRLYYSLSSRILFVNKHFNTVPSSIIIIATLCIEPCIRIISGIFSLSFRRIFETLHGYYLLWKSLPKLLRNLTTIK